MTTISDRLSATALRRSLVGLYREAIAQGPDGQGMFEARLEALVARHDPAGPDDIGPENMGPDDTGALLRRYRRLIDLALNQTGARQAVSALPLVMTSINPFARTGIQLRCLRQWQALGFRAVTCNHQSEVQPLRDLGLTEADILVLTDDETGLALKGKPVPRIMSVLAQARARAPQGVLLVNGDLFPAIRDAGQVMRWMRAGPAVALTRLDVLNADWPLLPNSKPYRGGLDAFCFTAPGLKRLLQELERFPVAQSMCFGSVGWDFLVGALVLERLQGTLMDSGVLLHEIHPTTYENVDGFRPYVPAMHVLGIGLGQDHAATAKAFADRIEDVCTAQLNSEPLAVPCPDPDPEALPVSVRLARDAVRRLAPISALCMGEAYLTGLAMAVAQRPEDGMDVLLRYLDRDEPLRAFGRTLMLMALWHRLRPLPSSGLTQTYPRTSRHAEAVRMIRETSAHDPAAERLRLVHLFVTELAEFGIFNARIYDVLLLSARHDEDRALLVDIQDFVTGHLAHAA